MYYRVYAVTSEHVDTNLHASHKGDVLLAFQRLRVMYGVAYITLSY